MALTLYGHPLASFCHKVLIALYEAGTPFESVTVDLGDPGDHGRFLDLWPVGKMPVLRDAARDRVVPETPIIIEYLDRHYPGAAPLLPADPETRLDVRLWDRFFDLHVQDPMQRIVADRLRPEPRRDPEGVREQEARLRTAYGMIERQTAHGDWAVGAAFSMADCAAAPALFYAGILVPFPEDHPHLAAYFERLLARPSFRRVLAEARPWFDYFPFNDRMPDRFRTIEPA
ncbi:MAG: glutathione S-transferase family protein [Rhodobacteraceae bacterium]|nr:glutathione S-transferase family protein [Paracoccaceae bacterium]